MNDFKNLHEVSRKDISLIKYSGIIYLCKLYLGIFPCKVEWGKSLQ